MLFIFRIELYVPAGKPVNRSEGNLKRRRLLLIDATCHVASVYGQDFAVGEGTLGRSEVDSGSYDFVNVAEALHWSAHEKFVAARRVKQAAIQFGREDAGSDGIDADAAVAPLYRERSRQGSYGGFAGAISGDTVESYKRGERGDVDDASISICQHCLAEDLARAKRSVEVDVHDALPDIFGAIQSGNALGDTGGIDEDVNGPERVEDMFVEGLEGLSVGDVGDNAESASSLGLD